MYVDAQNRPSNAQTLVGAAATTVSTDSIDMLVANANPGRAGGLRAVAVLTAALVGGTAVQVQLIQSANADLSSPDVLASGPLVADATGVLGYEMLDVPLPDTTKRYLGFQYVKTGTHSAGAISAMIVAGTDRTANEIVMNTGL